MISELGKQKLRIEHLLPKNNTIVLSINKEEKKKLEDDLRILQNNKLRQEFNLEEELKQLNKTHYELTEVNKNREAFEQKKISKELRKRGMLLLLIIYYIIIII